MRWLQFCLWSTLMIVLSACGAPAVSTGQAEPTASQASALPQQATPQPTLAASATTISATATSSPSATPTSQPSPSASPTNSGDELHDTPMLDDTQSATISATPAPSESPIASTETATLAETAAPTATPPQAVSNQTVAASQPIRLEIPEINLSYPLVSVGLDKNNVPIVPDHDVAWYNLSARPGQGENVVLWAHVLRFKKAPDIPAPFARVRELSVGSQIFVASEDGKLHSYRVKEQVYATPDQVEYILPVGSEQLTLVSCIGDKIIVDGSVELSHRLITIAEPDK
jgi:LPXTG-site transpeptidase (sortase) family protein